MDEEQNLQQWFGDVTSTRMMLVTFFIPLNHNDGRRMQSARVTRAIKEISRHSDGLTAFFPATGFWYDHAVPYYDRVLPVQVVASCDPETIAGFARLAKRMEVLLEQKKIFFVVQQVYLLESIRCPSIDTEVEADVPQYLAMLEEQV